jgi:hypothetical protein
MLTGADEDIEREKTARKSDRNKSQKKLIDFDFAC